VFVVMVFNVHVLNVHVGPPGTQGGPGTHSGTTGGQYGATT